MERPMMNYNSNTVNNNYSVIKYCSVYKSDKCVTFVEEDGRNVIFQKNKCKISVSHTHKLESDSKFLFKSYGIIGSISFLDHIYLLVITEARKCGRLFHDHDVYSLKDHKIIPLFHPVRLSQKEREFLKVFNEFDISNNFYFSYTYNLSNSLRLNLSLKSLFSNGNNVLGVGNELLMFDPVLTGQKYCYNFSHKNDLCQINENCFSLSLNLIHGYFTEFVINVTGRNLVFTLISRRSRFYSGTRYKKRGITGSGHVANDIETEQILYDWNITRSISSFILIRGSTPIFWSQDPNETIIKKPPIFYTQNDPTNSSSREHFKELMGYYGSPIVVLNLLLDNPSTDEGQLSLRYQQMIEQLNNELPSHLKIHYFSKNIKSLLERGVAKQMLKEVVDIVHNKVKLTFLPIYPFNNYNNRPYTDNISSINNNSNGISNNSIIENLTNLGNTNGLSNFRDGDGFSGFKDTSGSNDFVDGTKYKGMIVQNGIIRISCLDCLDRTSAFAKHMSLSMFRHQLELIGINVNYEKSIVEVPSYFHNPNSPVSNISDRSNRSSSSSFNNSMSYDMEMDKNNNNTNNNYKNDNNTNENEGKDKDNNNKYNKRENIETDRKRENITISDYYGFNHVRGLLFEVLKEKYEKMCDVLSMQYAGSNALKKYEGQSKAISISRELFTTVRRRYRNFFEDAKIQEQTNAFLCSNSICKYSELGVDISQTDLDPYIHFQPISMQFSNVESFLISLAVNSSRSTFLMNNNKDNKDKDNKNNNNTNNNYKNDNNTNENEEKDNTTSNRYNDNNNNKENNNNMTIEKHNNSNKDNGSNMINGMFNYFMDSCPNENTRTILSCSFNRSYEELNSMNIYATQFLFYLLIETLSYSLRHVFNPVDSMIGYNSNNNNNNMNNKTKHKEIKEYKEHESCQLYKDILDKESSFYKIINNYLTIEDPIEEEYTNLAMYKPTHKLIKIVNMVSTRESNEGIQFFRKFSSVSITSMSSNVEEYIGKEKEYKNKYKENKEKQQEKDKIEEKERKEKIPLKIKNNKEDYSRYLVPEYTYNPENWTLTTRSNIESLNRYIHIVT